MRLFLFIFIALSMVSCTENYSNGNRIGLITQFSKAGVFWKSWEGHLNMTQTGMNSSQAFDFSVDNDNEPAGLVATLDSAAQFGWKVELKYHQVMGKNWFGNRGRTDHFVTDCKVLDRSPMQTIFGGRDSLSTPSIRGVVRDTIYVVIYRQKD